MNAFTAPAHHRGAVLIVGLLMLVILTLLIASAFTISSTNLKSVGNMQVRDEAVAAASAAISLALTDTTMPTGAQLGQTGGAITVPIDINNNTFNDFTVAVARTCLRVDQEEGGGDPSSVTLPFAGAAAFNYVVLWEYEAAVTDPVTGADVNVRQGIRELLSQPECDSQCPPSPGTPCS
jgi:hypothetical protein